MQMLQEYFDYIQREISRHEMCIAQQYKISPLTLHYRSTVESIEAERTCAIKREIFQTILEIAEKETCAIPRH